MGSLEDYGEARKFEISFPYGKIVGKEWGPEDGEPVLGLHGWQDNLATFYCLLKYLPDNIRFVAIDIVGHGHSCHLPYGTRYNRLQMVIDTRRVIKHLGWKKYSFLGHSMGGGIAIMYACIYPQEVKTVISIDALYPGTRIADELPLDDCIEVYLDVEEKEFKSPTPLTREEAMQRFCKDRIGMEPEKAHAVLDRGLKKLENDKVAFRRDNRLKLCPILVEELRTETQFFQMLHNATVRFCIIVPKGLSLTKLQPELQKKTVETIQNNGGPGIKLVEVEGKHYAHLINPEEVGKVIRECLTTNSHV